MRQIKLPNAQPWAPADHDVAEVSAIQALAAGNASPDQQKRALDYIIVVLAGTYDMSYRPNSQRDTDFAEGKRFVGNQIVLMTKLDTKKLAERKQKPKK